MGRLKGRYGRGAAATAMCARKGGDAPREAPQAVHSLADLLAQIMDELNNERAAAEEQEPHTPIGMSAVKAQN
jgi:hypothetical protein